MVENYTDDNGNRVLTRHIGPPGPGIPSGGTTGKILQKASGDDYDTEWVTPPDGTDAVSFTGDVPENLEIAIYSGTTGKEIKASGRKLAQLALKSALDDKVDKVTGKGLSSNNFSDSEKTKLENLSTGCFRGVFASLAAIEANDFEPNARAGDYCYIEVTDETIQEVLWDNTNEEWVVQTPDAVAMTGSEIATELFATDDPYTKAECRVFTGVEKAQLASHQSLIDALVGGVSVFYTEKNATYTATANDRTINATSGTFTVTLPTAVGIAGRIYVLKNSGAGTVTLAADGSELIDGLANVDAAAGEAVTVQSTGAGWIIL